MESRTKNSVRNVIYGLIQKFIGILLPFIVRSIFIYKLGKEYLGLDSLFLSLLQVLSLAELGFGNALVYSMYKPIAEHNKEKICALLNFYKKCYSIIGLIVLVLGIIISLFLPHLISGNIPSDVNIYVLYFIFLLNTVLSYFLFAYKNSLLVAHQRMDIGRKITILLDIIKNCLQFCIIFFIKNYYLYVCILPIITIMNNICVEFISNKMYPEYQPYGKISKEELSSIKKNVKGMFLQKFGSIATQNVDNIIISAMLGLSILGIYNNYYYIVTAIVGFISILIESIKASVGNSVTQENVEKNFRDFKIFNFLFVWIITWASGCLACLLQDFIYLWVGESMQLSKYIAIIFGVYFFVHHWCDLLYVYQEGKGLWWENRYTQLITAILNLILSIILVNFIGLEGALIATIVTILLITDVGYAKVLFKNYFNKDGYFKEYLLGQLKYIIIAFISIIPTYYLCSLISEISISSFILKICLCLLIPNIIIFICNFKSKEFNTAKGFINNKILRRLKNEKQI